MYIEPQLLLNDRQSFHSLAEKLLSYPSRAEIFLAPLSGVYICSAFELRLSGVLAVILMHAVDHLQSLGQPNLQSRFTLTSPSTTASPARLSSSLHPKSPSSLPSQSSQAVAISEIQPCLGTLLDACVCFIYTSSIGETPRGGGREDGSEDVEAEADSTTGQRVAKRTSSLLAGRMDEDESFNSLELGDPTKAFIGTLAHQLVLAIADCPGIQQEVQIGQ